MLEVYKPLQNQAYEYIVNMIQQGQLHYDQIYSETRIAACIGISRTPVRDAIHRLSQDGFLDIIPSKGFCLHRITKEDILETFQIRSAMESYCAFLMAEERDTPSCQKTLEDMDELLERQRLICSTSRSLEDFTEADNEFHRLIHFYPQNATFEALFSRYLYRIRCITLDSLASPQRMEATLKEHQNIIEAIRCGDGNEARNTTLMHIKVPKDISLAHQNQNITSPQAPLPKPQ